MSSEGHGGHRQIGDVHVCALLLQIHRLGWGLAVKGAVTMTRRDIVGQATDTSRYQRVTVYNKSLRVT